MPLNPLEEDDLVQAYQADRSITKLSRQTGHARKTIRRILHRHGVDVSHVSPTGNGNTRYAIHYDYFSTIDSHEKAYVLGLLWADGHNARVGSKCEVRLALHQHDFYILEYIRDLIYPRGDKPVYVRAKKRQGVLSIRTKSISDDLARLGMVGNKTRESHLPLIDDRFMPSFMLGYFDGDGCIYLQRRKTRGTRYGQGERYTSMCASVDIISNRFITDEIVQWFAQRGVTFRSKVLKGRNPHYPHIYICGYDSVKRFYDIVYAHQKTFLRRKHERFVAYFRYKTSKTYASQVGPDLTPPPYSATMVSCASIASEPVSSGDR